MQISENIILDIQNKLPSLSLKLDEPMSLHTSFGIGGKVKLMAMPSSITELKNLCYILKEYKIEPYIIGRGSNLLVSDEYHDKIFINTTGIKEIEVLEGAGIVASAGANLSNLAVVAKNSSLTGLEFAHGIPGTVGGAIYMNAGAYGGEISDDLVSVTFLDEDYNVVMKSKEDLDFSYRHSIFGEKKWLILEAMWKLETANKEDIAEKMRTYAEKRTSSQPLNYPSAGSTFKRPKDGFAAAMIDQSGLKGLRVGGAEVSTKHAGFVVNVDKASFSDVIELMEQIIKKVQADHGVNLEAEVKIIN